MKRNIQHLMSCLSVVIFVFIAFGSMEDNGTTGSSTGENISDKSETIRAGIGDVLSTQFFDVTINQANLHDRVNTGNQFADLKREDGIEYLVLNITFKNTDDESRMITDGELLINFNGREYRFDKSETVMLDGWGLFLDQINPLTSKTTNIVYKIPEEINGTAYYRPGRSSNNSLILIGNIE